LIAIVLVAPCCQNSQHQYGQKNQFPWVCHSFLCSLERPQPTLSMVTLSYQRSYRSVR
jgi:hypothetical protein